MRHAASSCGAGLGHPRPLAIPSSGAQGHATVAGSPRPRVPPSSEVATTPELSTGSVGPMTGCNGDDRERNPAVPRQGIRLQALRQLPFAPKDWHALPGPSLRRGRAKAPRRRDAGSSGSFAFGAVGDGAVHAATVWRKAF